MTPSRPEPPEPVREAARARADARAARDWARADALKAEIEADGWKVVDRGTDYRLEPAAPPTVEEDGLVRYGSAAAVPSVLDAPPSAAFTVLLVAEDQPDRIAGVLAALRAHAPARTHVVIVANDPAPGQADRLAPGEPDLAPIAGEPPELAWTSTRLGRAAARNVGLQRARGEVVILADGSAEPTGDAQTPLAAVLVDPTVAVAGAVGSVTADLRRYDDAPGPDADVIGLEWLAFRRADLVVVGGIDERFVTDDHLGAWWSLVLRAGADPDAAPRRAVRADLPLRVDARQAGVGAARADVDRRAKRGYYRVLDRFRDRPDLRSGGR